MKRLYVCTMILGEVSLCLSRTRSRLYGVCFCRRCHVWFSRGCSSGRWWWRCRNNFVQEAGQKALNALVSRIPDIFCALISRIRRRRRNEDVHGIHDQDHVLERLRDGFILSKWMVPTTRKQMVSDMKKGEKKSKVNRERSLQAGRAYPRS